MKTLSKYVVGAFAGGAIGIVSLALALSGGALAHAANIYVSATGSDANSGKTAATSFRSLAKAAQIVQPGDTVLIGDGAYGDSDTRDGSAVLTLSRPGTPNAWITWKALPGQHPVIRPSGWQGIAVRTSYQVLDGLTVIGNNDSITLIDALKDAAQPHPDPHFNTNGITVEGRQNAPDNKPHHVVIRNCVVGKCAGGGIAVLEADYVTVEDCRIFENAWYSRYGCSGFTTLNNWAFDDAPGYHIIVQRNVVWNNKGLVPWGSIGKLSDGNGIILDVTDQERKGATNPNNDATKPATTPAAPPAPEKPKRPEWKGRALIANNVSAFNGGSGIHTFRTRYVDIINNTTYWNGQVVGYQEIFANNSQDITILNNVIIPRPGGQVTSNNRNTNVRWDYNLYPTAQTVMVGPHDLIADPRLVDVQPDPTKGSFALAKNSPGLESGTDEVPQATNITGKPRPKGKPNRGRTEMAESFMAEPFPVRWGVIGCGQIALDKTVPGILKAPNAALVAVADPKPERLDLAHAMQPGVRRYADYHDLLADETVEAVYIALPTGMHGAVTIEAARAGKHILCEKPLGLDAAEVRQMARASREAGVALMTAYMSRFGDAFGEAKRLIAENRIGPVTMVYANFSYDALNAYPTNSPGGWRWTDPRGGGPLLDVGVYLAFGIRELLNDRIQTVSAKQTATVAPGRPVSDTLLAWFETERGVPGLFTTTFSHDESRMIFYGTSGRLEIAACFSQSPTGGVTCDAGAFHLSLTSAAVRADHFEHYTREIVHLSQALRSGGAYHPTAPEVLADMLFLDAVRESARTGQTVEISHEDHSL